MSALKVVSPIPRETFHDLHSEAMAVAKNLRSQYLEMFEVLIRVERGQIYYQFEVPSIYLYCVELLELSPSVAKDFITVVRKSLEVPELADAVRSKKITIFKAKKICSVLNSQNHKEWIDLAETCSTRIVEKAVAQTNPREAVTESLTFASHERLELKLGISEEWATLLQQTKDLMSQKYKRAITSEEALFTLMNEYREKNDPVARAERVIKKSRGRALKSRVESRHRPAEVEHRVNLRDQSQCVYIDVNGKRCESTRWLHKHHIKHFGHGGRHEVENLETLCSGHHKIRHIKESSPQVSTPQG